MSLSSDHKVVVLVLGQGCKVAVLLSGNALVSINVVALRWARLALGWVTVRGYAISVFNQATQAYSAWPSLCG